MNNALLSDALAEALGKVVADAQRDWRKDSERNIAEGRATIAELRAEVLHLKTELKEAAGLQLARMAEVVAGLKDGLPGGDGRDGEAGLNGKDADPQLVEQMVTDAIAKIQIPKDGRDGEAGQNGKDADMAQVASWVAVEVGKAVSGIPVAKDGLNGADGAPGLAGRDGRDGLAGVQGEKGLDGVHGRDGVDGKDGLNGKDGRDGLSVEDFEVELAVDGRTLILKLVRDDIAFVHELTLPVMIYRGVFKDGDAYERGDTVTWGGSLWHCDDATSEKPEGGKAWTLCAKRGRDGKDGKNGERGIEGKAGRDGSKW